MSFEMTIKISGLDDLSMRMGESHAGSVFFSVNKSIISIL